MLDVYELSEGSFEIVDSQMQELRAKRILYHRLIRFVIILLSIFVTTFLLIAYFTSNIFWAFPSIIPIGLIVFSYKSLQNLNQKLKPEISSILLDYDREKQLQSLKIRIWLQNKIDEFFEEEIRHNQAVGFRIIWFDNGNLNVEIIVDEDFPGTKVFSSFDFFAIAELSKLFRLTLPNLEKRQFQYEDGTEWEQHHEDEFYDDEKSARVPWLAREFFKSL